MCGVAISRFGYSVDLFYDLTPIEFKYAVKDSSEREIDSFKVQWEVARYTILHLCNISGKSLKHPLKSVQDVGVFHWETEELLSRTQSTSEMARQLTAMERVFKNVKKKDKKKKKENKSME